MDDIFNFNLKENDELFDVSSENEDNKSKSNIKINEEKTKINNNNNEEDRFIDSDENNSNINKDIFEEKNIFIIKIIKILVLI